MRFLEVAQEFREQFDYVLVEFFESLEPSVLKIGPAAHSAWQVIRDFTLQGGKRLRPLLMSLAYEGYGGQNRSEILKAGCCIELMQTFLLIHDDIMDRSDVRRGAPTAHKRFEEKYQSRGIADLQHFGESLAILAGDIAMAYGAMAISWSDFPAERKLLVMDAYAQIAADEGYGQILDMQSETGRKLTEQDVLDIFYYKTTRYSIEGPLHLGAVLAGAPDSETELLSSYARPLGNAFQLQDDILGLFGNEAKIGKPVGSDLKEGKQTLLILATLERAPQHQRAIVQDCLGNQSITPEQVGDVRRIVEASGALDYAKNLISTWADEAKIALQRCALFPETQQMLAQFADYLVEREF